jgi:hypothetical protein
MQTPERPGFFEPPAAMPAPQQLDFGVRSAFTNPDVAPQMVDGYYEYALTLTPETAEPLAEYLDGTLAAIDRVLVTRLGMSSEGVFFQEAEGPDESDEYIMIFKSLADPAKSVGIRVPQPVSTIFVRVSTAFSQEEAHDTIVYDVDNAILDMTSPLEEEEEEDLPFDGVLTGRNDENLTFYERLAPVFSADQLQPTPMPINNTVFDQEMHEDVALTEFVLPGNKLVFMFGGKQTGVSYMPLVQNIRDGGGIFYECTRAVSTSEVTRGAYEFHEVYSQPYIEILPRFYVTLQDFSKLLVVPVHPYWELKDAGKTLAVAASRMSVINGGPVVSMLHCQAGSDLKVYTIEPYMPQLDKEEEEEALEVPKVVYFQRGEERTPMDISSSANAALVKRAYATEKGVPPESIQLIVQGKLLTEQPIQGVVTLLERDVTLVPGTTVAVVNARQRQQGARRRTYRRRNRKQTRKR